MLHGRGENEKSLRAYTSAWITRFSGPDPASTDHLSSKIRRTETSMGGRSLARDRGLGVVLYKSNARPRIGRHTTNSTRQKPMMSRARNPMRPKSGRLQNGWYMLPSMFPYATAIVILP